MIHLKDWLVILGSILVVFGFAFVMSALLDDVVKWFKIWKESR